jgi:uncharacterized protein (UPF0332 family)
LSQEADLHREHVRSWWRRATENLSSAHLECEQGSLSVAASRLYYAAFYAVQAWLAELGISRSKHAAVRAVFQERAIRTGLLDVQWGRLYDR